MINICNKIKNYPKIKVEENKKKAILNNPQNYTINEVKVDGCLITNGNKCDYLWEIDLKQIVYYIELKGKNISHALTQILDTINYCKQNHNNFKKFAIVVLSRHPQTDSTIQRKKKELKKQGITLYVKNNKWEGNV